MNNEDTQENLSGLENQAYVQCKPLAWHEKNRRILDEFESLSEAIRGKPVKENDDVSA